MQRILVPLVVLAGWLPLHAGAVCFTVFEGERIVYRDLASPIDLSGPISDAMRADYPRGQLIISPENENCTQITRVTAVELRAPVLAAPLAAEVKPGPKPDPAADAAAAAATAPRHPAAEAPTSR